ncbi:MAG TPA: PaaI family thioesterase [Candidatus Dormibacteraeota bacterium]|jgi:uncharacterized protein (TIGR00369 family)|nr:PaaI family thioesterase [Candidatus Dormibacteraeota bacterium]
MRTDEQVRTRMVTWQDPAIVPSAMAGQTGLEVLRAVFEGRLPKPPISELMGFTGVEVEEGRAVFEGDPAEYLYNPIGSVHAGFAMTLLDSAMSCAIHSTLGAGERYATLEAKVNLVRAITIETGRVRCEGGVLHRGGRIATAEGKLIAVETGKLLAHGTTTCIVLRQ